MLRFRSYAKINLYLDVLNRRHDGFNNIETIFQSVSLADELALAEDGSDLILTCSDPSLSCGEENLVMKAALLLRERSGLALGARMHLEKRIPISAGLAGGSGNAAAALTGLNELWGLHWPPHRLARLGLDLGSDVPFCLTGGTAAATRRGEALEALPPLPETWLVLVHPPLPISAGFIYNHPRLERSQEVPGAEGRSPAFVRALAALSDGRIADVVFNRMESAAFHEHPRLGDIVNALRKMGCVASAMSGSGSTLFGVCTCKDDAERIAALLPGHRTSVVRTVGCGVEKVA